MEERQRPKGSENQLSSIIKSLKKENQNKIKITP
jgi:hypothetical protein